MKFDPIDEGPLRVLREVLREYCPGPAASIILAIEKALYAAPPETRTEDAENPQASEDPAQPSRGATPTERFQEWLCWIPGLMLSSYDCASIASKAQELFAVDAPCGGCRNLRYALQQAREERNAYRAAAIDRGEWLAPVDNARAALAERDGTAAALIEGTDEDGKRSARKASEALAEDPHND